MIRTEDNQGSRKSKIAVLIVSSDVKEVDMQTIVLNQGFRSAARPGVIKSSPIKDPVLLD